MLYEVITSLKIAENHSVGITGVLAYQYFEAKGLNYFGAMGLSADSENLSNKGKAGSTGVGFKIGYMGKLAEGFTVGAMYQSKVYMSELDEYAGLFAEQGDFDIPSSWTAGFAWDVTNAFTVMADVKQIFYSGVKSIANPMLPSLGMAMGGDVNSLLGTDDGPGFGWKDVTVVKLGVSCSAVEKWTFRAGYSIGENPVPKSELMFNILAPGVITNQLGFGLTRDLGEKGSQFVITSYSIHYTKLYEDLFQLQCNNSQRIGVVTLSCIDYARDTTNIT